MRTYSAGIVTAYGSAKAGGYTGTYAEFCEALGQLADVLEDFESFSVVVNTLPEGSSATASYADGVLTLGIPKGDKGDKGDRGETGNGIVSIVKTGTSGLVDTYTITYTDGNTETFTVTNGAKGDTGEKGDTGNGISSIVKTSTSGLVDTYTITYTDGTTTTFDVTNGEVSEAELESALNTKADVILNTASGAIASFSDGSAMPIESLVVGIDAVQSGSGDPSPTNIRPISGWDAIKIGKNNLDFNHPEALRGWQSVAYYSLYGSTEYDATTNTITLRRTMDASILLYLGFYTAGTTVHFIVDGFDTSAIPWRLRLFPSKIAEGENFVGNISQQTSEVSTSVLEQTMTLEQDGYLYFSCYDIYSQTSHNVETIVNPRTYYKTITLPQTVYGGVLDVTSGVLTINKVIVDLGTLNWEKNTSNNVFYAPFSGNANKHTTGYGYRYASSVFNYGTTVSAIWNQGAEGLCVEPYGVSSANRIYARLSVYDDMTATEFKTAMNGVQVVYELETPQTITLTPTEVSTVLGYNNIFADSGEVEVTYRADTKKYIDGTIVDVPLAMIAPIENGTKSSKAYAVGEYFILNGNQFCKALTSIASGATFTLNTNYTITTIGAELKALA